MKQVLCKIGKNTYGIDIDFVQGIEKDLEIVPVPNAPEMIEGIVNLRGHVIPVYSLYKKFHVKGEATAEETKYVIVRIDDMMIAFQVDAVAEIVELQENEFHPLPSVIYTEETSYVQSIVQVGERLVVVIDVEGVLNEKEKEHISKLIEEQ